MALLDIQVTLQMASGVPNDAATNIWHFDDGEVSGGPEAICDCLEAFYDTARPLYSTLVRQNLHEFKVYRVSDPEPRAPIFTRQWAFPSSPSGTPLPPEVSVVLSYQASQVSGVPQARRRGRVYLGPLNTSMIGNDGRLSAACMTAVEDATEAMVTAITSFGQILWATHSKVLGEGYEVTSAWVDNEPDTQRRRGREATVRTTIPVDQS